MGVFNFLGHDFCFMTKQYVVVATEVTSFLKAAYICRTTLQASCSYFHNLKILWKVVLYNIMIAKFFSL